MVAFSHREAAIVREGNEDETIPYDLPIQCMDDPLGLRCHPLYHLCAHA